MRHGKNHVDRHERLERMGAGLDERTDVFADQAALADVDQLLGRLALLRIEFVLGRDAVEILENAIPKVAAVADFEEQPIETVGLGRRMLVELVSAILELEAAVTLRGFRRLI